MPFKCLASGNSISNSHHTAYETENVIEFVEIHISERDDSIIFVWVTLNKVNRDEKHSNTQATYTQWNKK